MGEKEKKVNWNWHVEGKKITESELACGGVITDSEWAREKKTEGVLTWGRGKKERRRRGSGELNWEFFGGEREWKIESGENLWVID